MKIEFGLTATLILSFGFETSAVKKDNETFADVIVNVTQGITQEDRSVNNHAAETTEQIQSSRYDRNSNSNVNLLNFPHNLQIINEVLKKLRNAECVRDTMLILEGMTRHEKWALELFDSFPKFPVGILYGNYHQLGNFDECVGVKHTLKIEQETETTIIQGQYCLADIHFQRKNTGRFARSPTEKAEVKVNEAGNYFVEKRSRRVSQEEHMQSSLFLMEHPVFETILNITVDRNKFNNNILHWGICLPSSCSTEDAQVFVQEIFASAAENFEVVHVTVDTNKCYYENSPPFTVLEILYGCIIGLFIIFILLATGFHCWYIRQRKRYVSYNIDTLRSRKPKLFHELLICFSCINSIEKFLHVKPNELNLECICGIKFLSMSLIIAGHSLIFMFGGPMLNRDFFKEMSTKWENGPLLNNALLVDTFLLVSGFLLCRLLLIELEKRNGKLNVLFLYIARYIRLTPAYLVVIGLYTTLLYRWGSGPFWQSRIGLEKDRCINSWWTNILYINNYIRTEHLCMFQSWYLAVDYHLFIISPVIIYPLWNRRKFGESLLIVCTLISMAIPFWITFRDNLDPTLMAYPPEMSDISTNSYFLNVYMKTHMRASSYFIGLAFGYLVHKLQSTSTKIKPLIVWLGLMMAAGLGIMSMYSIVIFYNPEHMENSFESAVYASLHRVAWCLAIGWVMVVCVTDNAALINKFLCWKLFIPASRLTYCAYLSNGLIEIYNIGVLRQELYLSRYELTCKILGHLVLTYTGAFILCIFFESPIHSLEKILLRKDKIREQKQNSTLTPIEE